MKNNLQGCNGSDSNSDVWGFSHTKQFLTRFGRPTIQLNSDPVLLEILADPTGEDSVP